MFFLDDVSFRPGLDIKDVIQEVSLLAGILAVLGTLIKSWLDSKLSREQSARDLRWKQAEAAKALNDEMLTDPESDGAAFMLDNPGRKVEIPSTKEIVPIEEEDILRALCFDPEPTDEKSLHIRDCFDSLFYYLATLEHYIKTTLILEEDVKFPLDYYLPLLAKFRSPVDAYLIHFKLHRAQKFLAESKAWQTTSKPAEASQSKLDASAPASELN